MLKIGFLRKLSNWVSDTVIRDPLAADKAAKDFGFGNQKNSFSDSKLVGLFSEWLVFDFKQDLFNGDTGLQYFLKHNPLNLSQTDLAEYQALENFDVGLFTVKNVDRGKGLELEFIPTGKKDFVNDINASLSLKQGDIVWARIASVGGFYHAINSSFLIVPVKIGDGMRQTMSSWEKNSLNAKEITFWLNQNIEPLQVTNKTKTLEQAEMEFAKALEKCGMGSFFSFETFKKWVSDEKRYSHSFAIKALVGLLPEDVTKKNQEVLISTFNQLANQLPREKLNGKTPNEAYIQNSAAGKEVEIDIISKEKYVDQLAQGSKFLNNGELKTSQKTFEQTVRDLLKDRVPLFHSFRIYANTAVCCFHQRDYALGEQLVDAALRINPLYDFAQKVKNKYVTPLDDLPTISRKEGKDIGEKKYKKSVFFRYENFLKDIGVSLRYQTNTKPDYHYFGTDGKTKTATKIERNDPCYCGSGKKFKKCHGQGF